MLADKSTTEFPRYWIEHPELFCAPAREKTAELRILAVLKWFLSSLKAQQYAGRDPSEGTKKPLNAFLGEVFIGECGPHDDVTTLVAEQVSHHPPVTACYLANDKHGVRSEGYTRQEVTFSGSVNIKLARVGGITGAVRMRGQAQDLGMTMCIEDVWGGDVTTATKVNIQSKPD